MVKQSYYSNGFWVLAGLAMLLLFVRLGAAPIYILDEAKNAQCAREMWDSGNWVYPTFNHLLRTDKPALHYWFMIAGYSVFGAGAGAARFFSAIMGLGVLVLTFLQVRRHAGAGVGFFSMLTLLLSPHFLFEFRLSVPDPYLIFFSAAGLFAGFDYINRGSRTALLGCAALLGFAALAKGPVAFALPGLILFLYIITGKRWHIFKDPFLVLALLLAVAIAFPWYYLVHIQSGGAFTRGFFLEHNLNRFSSEKEGHGGPFIITPLIVMIGLLPFSLLIFESLKKKYHYFSQPLFRFSFLVVLVYVGFFSLSNTKLPNYPMPCYPFAAIMAAYFLKDAFEGINRMPGYLWWVWLFISVLIPIAAFFGLKAEPAVAHLSWVAAFLFMLPAGSLLAFLKRKEPFYGLRNLVFAWLVFSMFFLWVGYPVIYAENPVTKLLPLLESSADKKIVAYKGYNPGFNFNLPENSMILKEYMEIGKLASDAALWQATSGGKPFFVVTRLDFFEEFKGSGFKEIARQRDLFELPTTLILKWEP